MTPISSIPPRIRSFGAKSPVKEPRLRFFSRLLLCACLIMTVGCGRQQSESPPSVQDSHKPSTNAVAKQLKIGVTQIATHPGIDAVRKGFVDEMTRQGFREGQEVAYEFTNANGDFTVAQAIAKKFAASSLDLIFSISTPSSQTCMEATKNTSVPIVFGAVTDPLSAGLVKSLEKPGGRVTGTSDVWPIADQFQLLRRLVPGVHRVGILHNPTEANSQHSVKIVNEVAKADGLEIVSVPVNNANEVPAAARSLIGRVDAIYIPADNTVISAIAAVVAVSEQNKIPLMPGDTSNVEVGGFGTIGHDYYSIGVESAKIASKILRGTPPGDIPVATSPVHQYYFNLISAKATGVQIPEELLKQAAKVYGSK